MEFSVLVETMQHNTSPDYDYAFKILTIGDSGSGKSWFLLRVVEELMPDANLYQKLNELDFKIKTITDPETDKKIKLQLWKHKEERFRTIGASPFRGAQGVIVTVDVTSRESFDNLKKHFQLIDRYAMENARVLVMATKSDDVTNRKVWNEEILDFLGQDREYWADRDVQFIETSAKQNYNIDQALQLIARSILRRILEIDPNPQNRVTLTAGININKKEKPRCIVM